MKCFHIKNDKNLSFQFLQYDVEAPPIREFTFCIWLRFFDLSNEQSIFTYVGELFRYFRYNVVFKIQKDGVIL